MKGSEMQRLLPGRPVPGCHLRGSPGALERLLWVKQELTVSADPS